MKRLILFAIITCTCAGLLMAGEDAMRIRVEGSSGVVVYELNDSEAAKALAAQLPLELEVSDFSDNEKVFYPPESLPTAGAPMARGGRGVLAYYRPWGDVVMFYDSFSSNSALYELGHAISGQDAIGGLAGRISVRLDN